MCVCGVTTRKGSGDHSKGYDTSSVLATAPPYQPPSHPAYATATAPPTVVDYDVEAGRVKDEYPVAQGYATFANKLVRYDRSG